MKIGSSVVVLGRIFEVMDITPTGDVQVQDLITLDLKWVDYYMCRFIDPHENPAAVLEAMATIRGEPTDEQEDQPVESSEEFEDPDPDLPYG